MTDQAAPILIAADGSLTRLRKQSFLREGKGADLDEDWLQDLLFQHAELLPCGDIDPAYSNVVPLCREMRTAAGPIDLVYVSAVLARAIAKIAFNYLAYVTSAEFALREEFDSLRTFIRFDEGERRQFVEIRGRPILGNESRRYRITDGHLVAVEWPERTAAIRGLVSPFNTVTYEVSLGTNFRGVWRPIERGNLFDWQSGTITELWSPRRRSSGLIMPPVYPLLLP